MIYFIADTHFGHENIIRLCNRPFSSVEEMDAVMINNWNAVVKPEDDIYIVGDFSFRSADPCRYADALNGKKHLVVGNHDKKNLKNSEFRGKFIEIKDIITLKSNNTQIVLCHYPIAEWDGMYRGAIHLFGHIHNNDNIAQKIMEQISNAYNVGVEMIGYTPRTIEEIVAM